eukprot:2777593-Pyramimonas_sp.AAC.1
MNIRWDAVHVIDLEAFPTVWVCPQRGNNHPNLPRRILAATLDADVEPFGEGLRLDLDIILRQRSKDVLRGQIVL